MTDKSIDLFAQAEHIVSAESMTLYAILNPQSSIHLHSPVP